MPFEVFRAFFVLGLTSFGGPIAHLGYFRREFVERRAWLDERRYADLVALCQFLPGPASSQVGFAIGFERAGWRGAFAAWCAFTLPSAVALVVFARGIAHVDPQSALLAAVLQALKVVAVAVVAQAVVSMARALCPDRRRRALAAIAAAIVLVSSGAAAQLIALAVAALIGWRWLSAAALSPADPVRANADSNQPFTLGRVPGARAANTCGLLYIGLALALPLAAVGTHAYWVDVFSSFYRAGALVFGGGHVVLPLLQAGVVAPGWVGQAEFMAGYGAAQAVPGPLFSFAAYLGAVLGAGDPTNAVGPFAIWLGAAACLVAIFLPGMLVLVAALPRWHSMRGRPRLRAAIDGTNAGVVGVLLAAWVHPVASSAVSGMSDAILAVALFALLVAVRWPAWAVVAIAVGVGLLRGAMG